MSVSLEEVLEGAGYYIKNNLEDAIWLISKQDEFEELVEICEEIVEKAEEDEDE